MLVETTLDHPCDDATAETVAGQNGRAFRKRTKILVHRLLDRTLPHGQAKLFDDLSSNLAGFGKCKDFIEIVVTARHI
ncbi:hypothetical protein Z045_05875 [Rhodococcus pyridinivorans KG-16]|uniref:Uncharacterized protein n=1 Tax=Rhodococcus pyridinivorans KG-16 TaxID=1441730 RepID=A0A0V9UNW8_9NOCA|nr:hypothetical protein Z045_05875 [Rhodococcus pyridinivorans KG-16]